MKSRTVRGSAFFMPPANNALGKFCSRHNKAVQLPHQPAQSGSTAKRGKRLEPACLPWPLAHIPAYLNPTNIFTSPTASSSAHSFTDFWPHLSGCRPISRGKYRAFNFLFFLSRTSSETHPAGIHIFFCPASTQPALLAAISAPDASILTQQLTISGMNPAVNAVQVFRQILPL